MIYVIAVVSPVWFHPTLGKQQPCDAGRRGTHFNHGAQLVPHTFRHFVWLLLIIAGFVAAFTSTVYAFGLDAFDHTLITGFGLVVGIAVVAYLAYFIRRF